MTYKEHLAHAQQQHPEETPAELHKRVMYRMKHLGRQKTLGKMRVMLPAVLLVVLLVALAIVAWLVR